ncbi:MAG: hypothetical protein JKX88_01190 [Marinicaulis sp.]|nr:hypothetical protein [Marinicaulis sp.]
MGKDHPIKSEKDRASHIWRIFGEKYPQFCISNYGTITLDNILITPSKKDGGSSDYSEFLKAKGYFEELVKLTFNELGVRYSEFLEEQERAFNELHPLNVKSALASDSVIDMYSKMALWTIDEAVALILDRSPSMLNKKNISKLSRQPKIVSKYNVISIIADRARLAHKLSAFNPPDKFLDWAESVEIEVPAKLDQAVRSKQKVNWKKRCDELGKELEQAKAEIDHLKAKKQETSISERERESLLKMILGIAMEQYDHDPYAARTETVKNIESDLTTHGLKLDQDTIRKYLHQAKDRFLPTEPD